jgi:hypothetical protein
VLQCNTGQELHDSVDVFLPALRYTSCWRVGTGVCSEPLLQNKEQKFLHFALSLWLPGSGLLMLGLVSLATSASTMS